MHQPTTGGTVTLPPPCGPRPVRDIDHFAQLFPGWRGRFEQLSRGRFEGTMRVARGRAMYAHRVTTNQSVRVRGRELVGVMGIGLVVPDNAGCLWQGRRLDAGRIVVRGGDVEADHTTSKRAVSVHLSLREDRFRDAVRQETGDDPGPMGWRAIDTRPGLFAALEDAIRRFLGDPTSAGRWDGDGDDIEEACLAAAVAALFPPDGSHRHAGLPLAARCGLVRRAEEVLRGGLRAALTEGDLCRELGVPGRTLRLAFRERFGVGPIGYWQTLRLNAARAALKGAGSGPGSVAGVAREFGFDHLGKFAGYYRRLFGELPSETSARRPRCHLARR